MHILFANSLLKSVIVVAILLILVIGLAWAFQWRFKYKELQKSEEKFKITAENSSDIIWHLDSDFRATYISPADERIRGFNKKETHEIYLWSILKPEGIEMLRVANQERIANKSNKISDIPAIYELEQICKEFIEKLRGVIWFESEVGKGSDVRFTLPLS